jgi:hypothetical protein
VRHSLQESREYSVNQRLLWNIGEAVSFPRFVTDLINGVFKDMLSSSTQQMNAYVELHLVHVAFLLSFGFNNVGTFLH